MSSHSKNDTPSASTPSAPVEATMPSAEISAPAPIWVRYRVPLAMIVIALVVLAVDLALTAHHDAGVNHTALASEPKGVTVVDGKNAMYRPTRRYVGAVQPWLEAKVGPQFTAAYLGAVLVRPGDSVKKGQIVATLDCRNASAQSSAVQMSAKAIATEQEALAHRAARMGNLIDGGFVSSDELEKQRADSDAKQAELLAEQAKLMRATLEVDDCILRAPFDGEVSERFMDPGSFARPGSPVVVVVDRHIVRITADVPESDFDAVAPKTVVHAHLLATGRTLEAPIARRAPSADPSTRTVHIEVDVDGADRNIPVGTTAEVNVGVGASAPAIAIPLAAATIKGDNATIFVVASKGDAKSATSVAHKKSGVHVLGERGGTAYLDPAIGAVPVVLEGRALLDDGDAVTAKVVDAKLDLDDDGAHAATAANGAGDAKAPRSGSAP